MKNGYARIEFYILVFVIALLSSKTSIVQEIHRLNAFAQIPTGKVWNKNICPPIGYYKQLSQPDAKCLCLNGDCTNPAVKQNYCRTSKIKCICDRNKGTCPFGSVIDLPKKQLTGCSADTNYCSRGNSGVTPKPEIPNHPRYLNPSNIPPPDWYQQQNAGPTVKAQLNAFLTGTPVPKPSSVDTVKQLSFLDRFTLFLKALLGF